ncbi:nuclease, partial [Xanthomonas citri pv. citri]|nr:nuclease [Xanthomonas citri pv. citri]
MGQVSDGLYELRRYVEEDPRWSGGRVRWTKALIAPYTDFADDFAAPESPRWAVHGRRDMDVLPARLEAAARKG